MDATIQVRQRGTLTLPADLRDKYGIHSGDIYQVIDLDGVFVLTPMAPELAREIERLREAVGLSMEEMLVSLREQRERYVAEQYGPDHS